MPEKPFFRKHDKWWVVQLRQGTKRWQHKLCKGSLPKGTDTRQQAYDAFNKLMADGTENLPPPEKIHVSDILRAFLKHSSTTNKQRTFEWYQMFLANFDDLYGCLKPYQVTSEIVDKWLKANKGWKGCRRGAVIALKRAFNWAHGLGKVVKNPLKGYKKPPARSRDRYVTQEERQKIFDNYPEGDCFRDFLFAMENTAARPGEVTTVTAAQVDLRTNVWVFEEHKTEEATGEKRYVILTPAMQKLTIRLMKEHLTGPLFLNEDGNPWNRNSIRCRFRRVREKLGLGGDLVAYLYRHAACTDLLESGAGLAQTCEILGHKGTEMVMRHYSKIRERRDHLREQLEKATVRRT